MSTTSVLVRSALSADVNYEILLGNSETESRHSPLLIGQGRFAKVFKAMQRSAGRNVKPVAIKILNDHVEFAAERLFQQEIEMLQNLSEGVSVHTVSLIDIIHLSPLVLCGGCGTLYQPKCPRCQKHYLNRKAISASEPQANLIYPALFCPDCKWEIKANEIQRDEHFLTGKSSKDCCSDSRGTIINFVDRDAAVMELLEIPGARNQNAILQFSYHQAASYKKICERYHLPPMASRPPRSRSRRFAYRLMDFFFPNHPRILLPKLRLLEKVRLMVQLSESVAWLHSAKRIIHKDLAPDNVLLRSTAGDDTGEGRWRGSEHLPFRTFVRERANSHDFEIKVIDFGLSDQEKLSRSWYEEDDVKQITIKRPYMSPEALFRKEPFLIHEISREKVSMVKLPESLVKSELSVLPSDIIVDVSDPINGCDLVVKKVSETAPGSGEYWAEVEGTLPQKTSHESANQQFTVVRRLGEPHDIFAVGGLFYYILTADGRAVDKLKSFVDLLQGKPCELTKSALLHRNREDYLFNCNAIPEPFRRHDLMLMILRAMVRGQPNSFVQLRTDRGAKPAQHLLAEVHRVYHVLQQEVFAADKLQKLRITVTILLAMLIPLLVLMGIRIMAK